MTAAAALAIRNPRPSWLRCACGRPMVAHRVCPGCLKPTHRACVTDGTCGRADCEPLRGKHDTTGFRGPNPTTVPRSPAWWR